MFVPKGSRSAYVNGATTDLTGYSAAEAADADAMAFHSPDDWNRRATCCCRRSARPAPAVANSACATRPARLPQSRRKSARSPFRGSPAILTTLADLPIRSLRQHPLFLPPAGTVHSRLSPSENRTMQIEKHLRHYGQRLRRPPHRIAAGGCRPERHRADAAARTLQGRHRPAAERSPGTKPTCTIRHSWQRRCAGRMR